MDPLLLVMMDEASAAVLLRFVPVAMACEKYRPSELWKAVPQASIPLLDW